MVVKSSECAVPAVCVGSPQTSCNYLQYVHTFCHECAMQGSVSFVNIYHLPQSCGHEDEVQIWHVPGPCDLTFWSNFHGDRKQFPLGKLQICMQRHLFFSVCGDVSMLMLGKSVVLPASVFYYTLFSSMHFSQQL